MRKELEADAARFRRTLERLRDWCPGLVAEPASLYREHYMRRHGEHWPVDREELQAVLACPSDMVGERIAKLIDKLSKDIEAKQGKHDKCAQEAEKEASRAKKLHKWFKREKVEWDELRTFLDRV